MAATLRTLLRGTATATATAASSMMMHLPQNPPPKLTLAASLSSHLPLPISTTSRRLLTSTFTFRRPTPTVIPLSVAKYPTFIISSDSEPNYSDPHPEAPPHYYSPFPNRTTTIFPLSQTQGAFNHPHLPTLAIPSENPFLSWGNENILEMESDEEATRLRVDMPGVEKGGVKIWVEKGVLLKIEGVEMGAHEDEMEYKASRVYDVALELDEPQLLKKEEATAEMKNGVLKVVIPKLKYEERKDIVHIKIL